MQKRVFSVTTLLIFLLTVSLGAQHTPSNERVKFEEIRQTDIDANLIRTSVFNYGLTGRETSNPRQIPYEWPKNTRQRYLALTGFSYGAEVNFNGNPLRLMMPTLSRSAPDGSKNWELMPISGYTNPSAGGTSKIANRLDKNSWPPFWPDKLGDETDPGWAGSFSALFGKNAFNADQELVFKTGDDLYDRFEYQPAVNDPTRRGIGMLTEFRIMQWSQVLIQDVVFILHFMQNDGSFDIQRAGVNIILADLVGGDGDTSDDIAFYDLVNDVAWSTDADGIGNADFGSTPVGVVATSFLETPGNAKDGIDNDNDGEEGSPVVQEQWLNGELADNGIDDNGNGLIDENRTHIPFITPSGSNPGNFVADGIDNDGDGEPGSPTVTADMITGEIAGNGRDDNGNGLRDETGQDVGRAYADGIDNNNDGVIDEGIDEMIDEERDDGVDNDGDWNVLIDDVGLDGLPGTGDFGEGDGRPTSGAGTGLPGEPNIDKTDISESDQIGLNNVQYQSSGSLNAAYSSDNGFFRAFVTPGDFYDGGAVSGDFNLFVGSGLFPIAPGQTERISMAVALGVDTTDALLNRDAAQVTYDTDYQFASAPDPPALKAVAGDGKVTLYWDVEAEKSFDRFLARLLFDPTSPYQGDFSANDFEGYRIYKSTDPGLIDPFVVTDAQGVVTLRKPVVQFDIDNQFSGLHPVDVNGVHFDLGRNTGLTHSWVDTNVVNGQQYFYVITAYDYGLVDRVEPNKGIFPSESPFTLTFDEIGNFTVGQNVAIVTPNAPAAGYEAPDLANGLEHIQGSSASAVNYHLVDRLSISDGQRYLVTFNDTTIVTPGREDTVRTKDYNLWRVGAGAYGDLDQLRGLESDDPQLVTLLEESIFPNSEKLISEGNLETALTDKNVVDGFHLSFANVPQVAPDYARLSWTQADDEIHPGDMFVFRSGFSQGTKTPFDYQIIMGSPGADSSRAINAGGINFQALPVNFSIYNTTRKQFIDFAFVDGDRTGSTPESAMFTRTRRSRDIIVFLEEVRGEEVPTWLATFGQTFFEGRRNPTAGDTLALFTEKPFLGYRSGLGDIFEFTTIGERADKAMAAEELDRIRVVPNPYVAAASWEPRNPFNTGRGPRVIRFNHLPAQCTIRIFNLAGELIRQLNVDNPVGDGSVAWDLLSKDNLTVSYGVYVYHIDAPGIGEKTGKFAIIK